MKIQGGFVMDSIKLSKIASTYKLKCLTPEIDSDNVLITLPDINRPALQLAGFYDNFDKERVQIIGNVENSYLQSLSYERKVRIYDMLFSSGIPCIICCRGIIPDSAFIETAKKYDVPVYSSDRPTSRFTSDLTRWLNVQLAPSMTIHGGLVDVYGEGVLIMGESGIGKSEAALELIKRGHRLVTDDVVIIDRVSDETLIGRSPEITRHFIELRGIGIIDVKTLFGVESVKDTQSIDMVIRLEEWSREKDYDRLGLEDNYIEFLGNKVVCYDIPIRPGRNVAVIVESAAINHRQKKMGYNAAKELYNRVQSNLDRSEGTEVQ